MMYRYSVLVLIFFCFSALAEAFDFALIPKPANVEFKDVGAFHFNNKTRWLVENEEQKQVANYLASRFLPLAGWHYQPEISGKIKPNSIVFRTDKMFAEEAYKISVTKQRILVSASSAKGFFYAIQTLRQLLPAAINAEKHVPGQQWNVPAVTISDEPRFGYRGFMLDVSRYFMPKEDVKRLLEYLAFHKINYFHWHLIDDNGWRLEIKKYPRLTDVGAWRVERSQYFPMRANPEQGEPTPVGGYYSQEDVREIIRFAKERFIEIIPEIEMPAHSNSALAAYPHLACPVVDKYIGVLPGIGGKNANIIYCAGNDTVFTFLEDVLTEVMELFPSKYIHIGGDEANKENWQKCPKCQARMQENNIPDEEELQSYFIRRINRFLMNHGKQLMGWDELADSEIPENAVIFGWRNSGSGAEKAGGKGFQYVKCPALKYYFIRYQGPQWFEPYTYFGNTTLKDVYEYEPLSSHHPESVTRNMLGIEACLWTEFVNNTSDAEYLIFPRLAAFAESAWSKPEHKNWPDFIRRTDGLLNSYDALGINYARSMFNIEQVVRPLKGKLEIQLDNIRPDTKIKYTTDGTEPDLSSQDYTRPFAVEPAATVKAVTFRGNERVGKVLSLNTIDHKAAGAEVISKEVNGFVLTNGLRGSEKLTDGEWVDVYDRDAVFIIQLDRATTFSEVKLGLLNNAGMLVHLPSHVCISVSTDGEIFNPVAEKYYTEYERFQQGMFRTTLHFQFEEQTAAFLKLELKNPELTPDKHVRADVPTRLAVDEVMVK